MTEAQLHDAIQSVLATVPCTLPVTVPYTVDVFRALAIAAPGATRDVYFTSDKLVVELRHQQARCTLPVPLR